MNVSLFVTCLTDLFSPRVGLAVVDVLEHFGCHVDFPQAQTCCGQPQFNNGFAPLVRPLAERMIRVFRDSQYVVTPSGSCCAMIREHYPALFAGDAAWETDALAFVAKTYEFVEFLTKVLKVNLAGMQLPHTTGVTFHMTCHTRGLGHGNGEAGAAACIGLIRQLQNASFVPLEQMEQCCGFGGTFSVRYPDISGAMVREKVQCGNKSGAGVMIVNDTGCAMNISGACHRYGTTFQVTHVAELLASAIRPDNLSPTTHDAPPMVNNK